MPYATIKISCYHFLFLVCISCNLPKDQRGSWERALSSELRIGVRENRPYAFFENNEATGQDIEMIREFLKSHNLKGKFIPGDESELIHKLKNTQIDLLIGGFTKKTVWKDSAGLSKTYGNNHVILVPQGENRLLFELESFLVNHQP